MINFAKLYSAHLRSSRRTILIASIGLICALTIVSSTNYYFDNSKKELIENYFTNYSSSSDNRPDYQGNVHADLPYTNQSTTDVLDIIKNTANSYNIDFFKSITINPMISGIVIPTNYSDQFINQIKVQSSTNNSAFVVQLTDQYRSELQVLNSKQALDSQSKLPSKTSGIPEVYVLYVNQSYNQPKTVNFNNSRLVNLYECSNCMNPTAYNSDPVNVTGQGFLNEDYSLCTGESGCITISQYDNYPALVNLTRNYYGGGSTYIFVSNLESFSSYIINNRDNFIDQAFSVYSIKINFDYAKIDPFNSGAVVNTVNLFSQKLADNFINNPGKSYSGFYPSFYSEYKFLGIQSTLTSFIFGLVLVSLPILVATIFVINYSFGLIYKEIVRHIGVFKTRGATGNMLLAFQLVDNAIIIILSILTALLAGIPLAFLVLRTDFLLSFNYPAPNFYILNFEAVSNLLFYCAIILTIIVNSTRIRRLSQMSIVDTEQPMDKAEPFWKKHYIDIVLFSFGMVMYGAFYILLHVPSLVQSLGPLIIILSLFMLPSPFALVIGIVLLINRLIPVVLNKIGTTLWFRTGDLIAFSFKNIIRHRQASTRAVMLIAILITFVVFFYTLPYSSVKNNEINLYYQNGAEAVANFGGNTYNETTLQIIENNFSQYLDGFSPYVMMYSIGDNYHILLVNTSSYLNSAYLNFDLGLKHNIQKDFKDLSNTNSSNQLLLNILVNQDALDNRHSSIGDNFTFILDQNVMKLHIIDSFVNWPFLKYRYQYYSSLTKLGIGDISYFTNTLNHSLLNSNFFGSDEQGVFFNFKDGVNQTLVSSWIEGNTSLIMKSITADSQKQFYSGIEFRLQVGQVNNDVLMVLAITIIVLIMFAYLQLTERRKEIFTERALGIKLPQISLLFFIETMILSITSLVLGIGVGVFLMELLAIVLFNPSQSYPGYQVIIPVDIILITAIMVLISSILVSVIPAYYVTKQDISKSFGEN